ncbi:4-coumarate--CoA ligase [Pigmentiphaga litoralis]|uniref:class I adenylate-forming enzyme family protein n=1 Tax=Pigmentiphaga litoralis TaxID=516702 RepID=UPI00167584D5|nr:AMP-binding protein [Pigmentiphaga litoralis]GGX15088.1 4-coumarate--CoA ligase [Pigmentiphaga litoralis]
MTTDSLTSATGNAADFVSFPAMIRQHAATTPDRAAFVCDGRELGWAALAGALPRVTAACREMGVQPADKVAFITTISLEALSTFFGVIAAGACTVPLATSATPAALLGMLRNADAKVLVVSADMFPVLADIVPEIEAMFAGRLVAIGFEQAGWRTWNDWMESSDARAAEAESAALTPDQDFNLVYSSGTTGEPKGILHRHGMRSRQARRPSFGLGAQSVMILATPIYSNTTLQPMLATLAAGGTTVVMPKFKADAYLELSQRHGATHTMLVPVQYQRILDCPAFAATDLSTFVLKQCTGAPLDAGLKARIQQAWPGGLREIYGLTEGGCSCVLDADAYPDKLGTVGKPAADHDVRIIDDAGKVLPQGEAGEIVGHSPYMMAGYYKRPDATEAFYWRDETGKVFHRTGDIGRFDEDGFLILLDRKKDMIISGGFNIYAADLESVLAAHPGVQESTVIGIPSAQWGETPLALVVPVPGSTTTADELMAWVNAQVGKTQRLSAVEYRDDLPRSALGKVLKRELRQAYWK